MKEEIKAYIESEMKKAEQSLKASQALLEQAYAEDAISRAYYAIFHSARAALKAKDIETTSHQALIRQFALHLVKPGLIEIEYGDILRQEKEDRETGDYETFVTFSLKEAAVRVQDAGRFLKRIQQFLKDCS